MDVLTGISAFWLSTWIMLMFRTFGIIARLVDTYKIALLQKHRSLHFVILGFLYLIVAPVLWQVIVSDYKRKKFILGYVNALKERK